MEGACRKFARPFFYCIVYDLLQIKYPKEGTFGRPKEKGFLGQLGLWGLGVVTPQRESVID
jgi:hypothetical protein